MTDKLTAQDVLKRPAGAGPAPVPPAAAPAADWYGSPTGVALTMNQPMQYYGTNMDTALHGDARLRRRGFGRVVDLVQDGVQRVVTTCTDWVLGPTIVGASAAFGVCLGIAAANKVLNGTRSGPGQ